MNKYQFKTPTPTGLGTSYYYCYGDNSFEDYLNLKNMKYKKLEENDDSGRNLFNEKIKEIERLNNIINDIDTYIHLWKIDDIGEKTMLILNDILLIKNGMGNEVIRLKEVNK